MSDESIPDLNRRAGGPGESGSIEGAPSDYDTVTRVLAELKDDGISASLVPGREGTSLRCTSCGEESAADQYDVITQRRMEGASDPDDMVMIVGARCPSCQVPGVVVLGYGPEASETDSDLVLALAPH